jgi:hypothetical protein
MLSNGVFIIGLVLEQEHHPRHVVRQSASVMTDTNGR